MISPAVTDPEGKGQMLHSNPFRMTLPAVIGIVCVSATFSSAQSPRQLQSRSEKVPRKNLLLVAIDDLRPSLGCYGDPLAKTPHLDAFARTAMRFNHAYCNQAVCGPSRVSMLTGLLPDRTGVWQNRNRFRDRLPAHLTLPEWFKQHGYHTQSIGKVFSGRSSEEDPQSWSVPSTLTRKGWRNYVLPENQGSGKQASFEKADVSDLAYRDGRIAELAVETLKELGGHSQPFFLAVGFSKPHLPFCAPSTYWDMHDSQRFGKSVNHARPQSAPDMAYSSQMELGGYRGIPKNERVSTETAVRLRHGYYACVSYVDAQVGKVLDTLNRLGLRDKTIVVIWGDHGFSLGEAGHWCKKTNFESDTRVPLLVRDVGVTETGVATDALIECVDLYPTLAELAGLPIPSGLDGQSFLKVLRNPELRGRDIALSQFARPFTPDAPKVMGYSVRTPAHRYTRWVRWPARELITEELYDYGDKRSVELLDALPIERVNLIGDPDYENLRNRMRVQMEELLRSRKLVPHQ